MKNVIVLVLDQFPYDVLGLAGQVQPSPTPFLDELFTAHFSASQLYSEGPYTEAALPAFLSSTHTLDYGGYLKALQDRPVLLAEIFQQRGYRTLNYHYQYSEQSSHARGFSDIYYVDFHLLYYWTIGVRLQWYGEVYRQGELSAQNEQDLIEILDSCFADWQQFAESARGGGEATALMLTMLGPAYRADEFTQLVARERAAFRADPHDYLRAALSSSEASLFAIKDYAERVDRERYERVLPALRGAVRRGFIDWLVREGHLWRLFGRRGFIAHWWRTYRAAVRQSRRRFGALRAVPGSLVGAAWDYSGLPAARIYAPQVPLHVEGFPSLLTLREHFGAWLDRAGHAQPFFANIHAMDTHSDVYISDDRSADEMARELKMILAYVQAQPRGAGQLRPLEYYLAAYKVDEQVRLLVADLKARQLWDNTLLVVTSDHGYWYMTRGNVNAFRYFDEDYHVPFCIAGGGVPAQRVDSLASALDIAPTILDFCGMSSPAEFVGRSMRDPHFARTHVTMEYLGEGSPDLERRDRLFIARSARYKVAYRLPPFVPFAEGRVEAIFDVQDDPLEQDNLKDSGVDVSELLRALRERAEAVGAPAPRRQRSR